MNTWKNTVPYQTFRLIDHTNKQTFYNEPFTALTSFAIDDALATSVSNRQSLPIIRLWVHPKTVVLGIPDSRLPYVEDGVMFLKQHGFHVIVRNSGGLAVALDEGVLNITLIFPNGKQTSIHQCYGAMVDFVRYMLSDLTGAIEAREIVGSYCPGDYDLSIGGKKFAGIAQRRARDGIAIQIYLDVEGNAQQRATLVKRFYDHSIKGEKTSFAFPHVQPEVMASLSELLGIPLTVADMKERATQTITDLAGNITDRSMSLTEWDVFVKRCKQMQKRNEKIARIY